MKNDLISIRLPRIQALQVGQMLRSLARDPRTPAGVDKAALTDVGTAIAMAAMKPARKAG